MIGRSSKRLFFLAGSIVFLATLVLFRDAASIFLFERGLRAKKEWRLEQAIRYFKWTLRLKGDVAPARFEKGICHQLCGDFLAAQQEFDVLPTQSIQDLALRAQWLNAMGVNRSNFNESDTAIELHKQSLALARELGQRRLQARALIDLSRALYFSKGQADAALDLLQQALQLGRELPDELVQADALRNIGVVCWWFKGEPERSLGEYYGPALEIYRRRNDLRSTAITLSNIGHIYFYKGDLFQFMKYQNESLELKERIGDRAGLSDSYAYLGMIYETVENYRKARAYYAQSLELSRQIGYRRGENEAEGRLASVSIKLGEIDKAIAIIRPLLDRERGNPGLAKYLIGDLGLCYQLKGDLALARQHYQRALEIERRSGASDNESVLLTRLGQIYMATGDRQRAFEHLARAVELLLRGKEIKWWQLLPAKGVLAELLEQEGRRNEALKVLLEMAEIESQVLGSTKIALVQGQNWRIYDRLFTLLLNDAAGARAVAGVEAGPRQKVKLAFRFLEQLKYRSLKNLAVQLSDGKAAAYPVSQEERKALSQIEQVSGRLKGRISPYAMEQLQQAYSHYEDLILRAKLAQPRYELVRESRPAPLEEIQKVLDPETALLEYLYAGEKVFVIVITRSTLQSVLLPVTKPNLAAKVKLLHALIFTAQTPKLAPFDSESRMQAKVPAPLGDGGKTDWQPVAEDLRKVLIAPLERSNALSGIHRLGLIPLGFLQDLPFAALARAEGPRITFLVQDYSLFYAPSATFLKHSTGRRTRQPPAMISFGRNESDEPELPRLRFAAEEASAVAQIFNGQVRVGAGASETELKRLAPSAAFIHLATHAVSEPLMPLLSRLKLESTRADDGHLTVREILDLGLQAELVTLGACRTGVSFSSAGNELADVDRLGLIEAFLYAGAKSVLASLLPIDDRSTIEFMKAFYQNLRTMDKAQALAQAQSAMLNGELSYTENGRRHPLTHPSYWAPFILVGDYR